MPHKVLHSLRGSLAEKCPVCGAQPEVGCRSSRLTPDEDQQLLLDDMPAYLEFQILHAVHHLRNLRPDHPYVKALTEVLPMEDTKTQPMDFDNDAIDHLIKCIHCGEVFDGREVSGCPTCGV